MGLGYFVLPLVGLAVFILFIFLFFVYF
ncbi:hypothetical protein DSUL_20170 [Desulfovibrionales bacterium]